MQLSQAVLTRILEISDFMHAADAAKTGKRFTVGSDKNSHLAADSLEATGSYRVNRDFDSWTIRYATYQEKCEYLES